MVVYINVLMPDEYNSSFTLSRDIIIHYPGEKFSVIAGSSVSFCSKEESKGGEVKLGDKHEAHPTKSVLKP